MRYLILAIMLIPGSIPLLFLYVGVRLLWAALTYSEEPANDDEV